MDSRRFELEADLQELKTLSNSTTSPSIKDFLMTHYLKVEQELKSLPVSESVESPFTIDNMSWKTIDKFAWDQDSQTVKVYVTILDGFKSHPNEKVKVEHTEDSATVSIVDFNGINYRLRFPKLSKSITGARITAKSNGFSLSLKKEGGGMWETIEYKKPVIKKVDKKRTEPNNPSDDLIDMMKDMYENGDDQIKKTIAEAWTKARSTSQ